MHERTATLGALLQPGMELVYSSGGTETPWSIDSVARDTTLGGRSGCLRLRLRLSPAQAVADTRAYCADSATMTTWDERAAQHRPARPLSPGAVLELPQREGAMARFETGVWAVEQVSGIAIDVLPTTVTTRDSTGRVVRRLRERFAPALATATGGVFEVPDDAAPAGWRALRAFELVAIRRR